MKLDYTVVNLTPHEVKIKKWELDYLNQPPTYITYSPSGVVARLEENVTPVGASPAHHTDGTPAHVWLVAVTRSVVTGLPAQPEKGIYHIVSDMVFEACPHRSDLLAPYGLVRDEKGRIIGCEKFRCRETFFGNESRTYDPGDFAAHTKYDDVSHTRG